MSDFKPFGDSVKRRYDELAEGELYIVDIGDIFASYLAAFPEGTNPIYRVRTEHDCNCCKQFIRRIGCVVAIDENLKVQTVWDNWEGLPYPYDRVGARMQALVQQAPIRSIFRTKEGAYGAAWSADNHNDMIWHHFHGTVKRKHQSNAPQEAIGRVNTSASVFERGLNTITPESLDLVIDLVKGNNLYRGEEHLGSLQNFRTLQRAYLAAPDKNRWVWANAHSHLAMFRNTVIGTLLVDLSDGVDLEVAVKQFESKVAPYNYKRTTALISPKMIENAVAKLTELGLAGAVHRRVAFISDVSVNDVLWADRSASSKMKDGLTELLMPASTTQPVNIKNAPEVAAETFLYEILPGADSMDLLVQNRHTANFVSITGSDDLAPLFKWHNGFGWSYDGDVTDSIKERVRKAGGDVNSVLRVSLSWHNGDDLDLHVQCPEGHVFYGNKAGVLDVDMNAGGPNNHIDPVENMSWRAPRPGMYKFSVNQYCRRSTANIGFEVELFNHGNSQFFKFKKGLSTGQTQDVVSFRVDSNYIISEVHVAKGIEGSSDSQTKWGIKTETFVPVDTLMFSPNHWGGNAVGNKHWMFILRGCSNPEPTRGIYNEFLRGDLEPHRKVFEVLGSKTKCDPHPDGLAGLGFSSTRKDDCIVMVKKDGVARAYNVKF